MTDPTTEGISSSLATVYIAIALVLILASLLCNLAIMTTIYSFQDTKNPKDWFILNISLCDIVTTLFATLSVDNVLMNWSINDVFCKLSFGFIYVGFAATILNLCAMTLERYYSICYTNVYQKRSLAMKSKCSIPGIWLISVLLFVAYFIVYGRKTIDLVGGETVRVCDEGWSLSQSRVYYLIIPLFLLTVVAPVIIIVLLLKSLRKLRLSRTPSSGGSAVLNRKRKETVKMIFYMMLVHYACWIPTIVLKLVNAYGTILPRYWIILAFFDLPHHARPLFYILTYCLMYPEFRVQLKSLCSICCYCAILKNGNNKGAHKPSTGKMQEFTKKIHKEKNLTDEEIDYC